LRRDRSTFHTDQVEDFAAWMHDNGWIEKESNNEYEILRFMKADGTLEIVSFYKREKTQYITIGDRSAELYFEWINSESEAA